MIQHRIDQGLLLARTTRNLRLSQILHRVRLRAQRWPPARPVVSTLLSRAPRVSGAASAWPAGFNPIDHQAGEGHPSAEDNASGRFRFLNEMRYLGDRRDWSQPDASRLWRFHFHYFDWAWSFARHQDPAWARSAFGGLWRSWNESVPFGTGDAWSPYVASVRAWALCGVYRALVAGTDLDQEMVGSLGRHASFLRWHLEHDVGGNHLVKNLKALVGLAMLLEDERLSKVATVALQRQLAVQILADGGHYERSPSYHCQVLGDLIDIAGLLATGGRPAVPDLAGAIEAMRRWLGLMLMPDGDVPLFNDCVLVGPSRVALLGPGPPPTDRLTVLASSGYVVIRPGARLHLVADVGDPCPPNLPAHAHADCLSFELAVDGARLVVDSGTSTYEPGGQRAHERSTAAHNTITIDGADQTEVWGVFRAARLAHGRLERAHDGGETIVVTASHDGYRRLPGRPLHRRTWEVSSAHVGITDEVQGTGRHRLESRLHLASGVGDASWSGPEDLVVGEAPSTHATGFGVVHDGKVLSAACSGELPITIRTDLGFGEASARGSQSISHGARTPEDER